MCVCSKKKSAPKFKPTNQQRLNSSQPQPACHRLVRRRRRLQRLWLRCVTGPHQKRARVSILANLINVFITHRVPRAPSEAVLYKLLSKPLLSNLGSTAVWLIRTSRIIARYSRATCCSWLGRKPPPTIRLPLIWNPGRDDFRRIPTAPGSSFRRAAMDQSSGRRFRRRDRRCRHSETGPNPDREAMQLDTKHSPNLVS